ncbi:MAG: hypothetical protein COA41_00950 [Sphingopyxis sp.]|nr:MAG: hypothetical protein COA41_00950 [Sphingopyxis sp.]
MVIGLAVGSRKNWRANKTLSGSRTLRRAGLRFVPDEQGEPHFALFRCDCVRQSLSRPALMEVIRFCFGACWNGSSPNTA